MDFKKLFTTFEGRISRQPFWIGFLILMVASWILQTVFYMILGTAGAYIVALAMLVPGVAVCIKRLYDRGKPPIWLLLLLIPFVNLIWIIVDLGILEGTKGDNQYGPDPLAEKS